MKIQHENIQSRTFRSPLRWAGSKRKLLPTLSRYWLASGATRYLEGFSGSAAFFFHVQPSTGLLNDTNIELMSALQVLRDAPRLLHESLISIPPSAANYYEFRNANPQSLDPMGRAIRFFYLNRYCFNGIYRTNAKGNFNVPYSPEKTGGFPSIREWLHCSKLLATSTLSCLDFEKFAKKNVRSGDFLYLDPPYAVSNRRVFAQYSATSFGLADMSRLSDLLEEVDERGAKFLVSYAQSPEARMLAKKWIVSHEYAQRNVAGFATHRRRALEVLISNFDPVEVK